MPGCGRLRHTRPSPDNAWRAEPPRDGNPWAISNPGGSENPGARGQLGRGRRPHPADAGRVGVQVSRSEIVVLDGLGWRASSEASGVWTESQPTTRRARTGSRGRWALARTLRRMASTWRCCSQLFRRRAGSVAGGIPFRVGYPTDGRRFLLTHPVTPVVRAGNAQVFRYLHLARALGGDGDGLHGSRYAPMRAGGGRTLGPARVEPGERWIAVNPGSVYGSASAGPPSGSPRPRMRWRCGAKPRSSSSDRAGKWRLQSVARSMREPRSCWRTTDIGMLPGSCGEPLAADERHGCHARRRAVGTPVLAIFGPTMSSHRRGPVVPNRADAGAVQPVPRA